MRKGPALAATGPSFESSLPQIGMPNLLHAFLRIQRAGGALDAGQRLFQLGPGGLDLFRRSQRCSGFQCKAGCCLCVAELAQRFSGRAREGFAKGVVGFQLVQQQLRHARIQTRWPLVLCHDIPPREWNADNTIASEPGGA